MKRIKLEDSKGLWDLVLAAPCVYVGDGVYEVSDRVLEVLEEKGIKYTEIGE